MAEAKRWSARVTAVAMVAGLAAGVAVGQLASSPPDSKPAPVALRADRKAEPAATLERFQIPVTKAQPTRGPADAIVTIVQWCDVRGSACEQVEPVLTTVLAEYGDRIRLVFRHFAQPSNESQMAHELARIAHEQAGKFWEAKALLMQADSEPTRADLERHAEKLGLDLQATRTALDRHSHAGHVTADRLFAQMFGVDSAPAFFVNGRRLTGEPTAAAFEQLIEDELARATELVARGVPRDEIYAELTKDGTWRRLPTKSN